MCHRLKNERSGKQRVASDQINAGSLMRFVKQRRSHSLGLQSRLSNLELRGDRYYWSKVLQGGKKLNPPPCPRDSRDSAVPFISLHLVLTLKYLFTHTGWHACCNGKTCTWRHTHIHRAAPSSLDASLSDLSPIRRVSLHTPAARKCPTIPLFPHHLSFVPTFLIASLHLTLYSSCL